MTLRTKGVDSTNAPHHARVLLHKLAQSVFRAKRSSLMLFHKQCNSSKSEFVWCSFSCRVKNLDCKTFVIGASAVQPKNEIHNLSLIFERGLSMTSYITGLVRTSFAILRQLRSVFRSLTQDATHHLVQNLILNRIDYCNVAFAGLPQCSIIRLQAIINAAARLILRVKKFDHISTLLRDELQCMA